MPEEKAGKQDNPWEELEVPRKNELTATEIYKAYFRLYPVINQLKGTHNNEDIREALKKELKVNELILRGPVQVVKGERPILVINSEQGRAIQVLFDILSEYFITGKGERSPYEVRVETATDKDPEEALAEIKQVGGVRGRTPDHFLISQGLAEKLGIKSDVPDTEGMEIRIKEILGSPPKNLNLDEI